MGKLLFCEYLFEALGGTSNFEGIRCISIISGSVIMQDVFKISSRLKFQVMRIF